MARRGRRSREFARCFRSGDRRECTRRFGPFGFFELARGIQRLLSRREASVVAATRVVSTCTTRTFVDDAFAGSAHGSAGTVAFTTLTATATATATATRPASGAFAAIALGTLLLAVTHRRCDWRIGGVHVVRNGCDDRSGRCDLLTRFLRLAVFTRRPRFARLARRTRLLRLALALLAAFTTRLALTRAAFAALTLTLASVATSATRTFVTTGLLRLRSTLLVAPWFVAADRLAGRAVGTVFAACFVTRATFTAALAATASISTVASVATTIAATAAFAAIAVMARTITFAVLAAATGV